MTGPCTWPDLHIECEAFVSLNPEVQEQVRSAAITYLWNWTGQQYGLCEVTVRPCREECTEGSTFYGTNNLLRPPSGGWFPASRCGSCRGADCGCEYVPALRLPGPVHSVLGVEIDGFNLPEEAWRLSGSDLLRVDGGLWPTCQDFAAPLGDPDTWAVSYLRGTEVPPGGVMAAETLACELAKAYRGDKSCQLPQRVQSITRQGVTVAMLDSFDDVDQGRTGIWLIDSWVASVMHQPMPSLVYSPDVRRRRFR